MAFKADDAQQTTELPILYRDLIDITKYRIVRKEGYGQVVFSLQVKGKGLLLWSLYDVTKITDFLN